VIAWRPVLPDHAGNATIAGMGVLTLLHPWLERTNGLSPGNDGGMAEYLRVKDPKGNAP